MLEAWCYLRSKQLGDWSNLNKPEIYFNICMPSKPKKKHGLRIEISWNREDKEIPENYLTKKKKRNTCEYHQVWGQSKKHCSCGYWQGSIWNWKDGKSYYCRKQGRRSKLKQLFRLSPDMQYQFLKSHFLFLKLLNKKLHHSGGKIVIPSQGSIGRNGCPEKKKELWWDRFQRA